MTRQAAVPIVLSIAGSDPSGGAGIQGDLKTFSALGVYGAAVITALTVQNTRGVHAVHPVAAGLVADQILAVASDLRVAAVTLGALGDAAVAAAVADGLANLRPAPVVLDPVLAASAGAPLLDAAGFEVLRARLLPAASVVTPNRDEAAALLGREPDEVERDPRRACRDLVEAGARAVLLTGGHGRGPRCDDLLLDGAEFHELAGERVATRNTHGTGGTLAAALAAGLARGRELVAAAREAKAFVTAALEAADRLDVGSGRGPVHPLHRLWERTWATR